MAGIDAKARRRISRTWQELFPGFEIWRPMRLLRRIGPILQGVALAQVPGRVEYFPTAHVHPLTMNFPGISLSLGHRLSGWRGVDESVSSTADEDAVRDAADRLRAQSPLPLGRIPALDEVLAAYRDHLLSQPISIRGPSHDVEQLLALARFSPSKQVMAAQAEFVEELSKSWRYRPDGVHGRDECLRRTLAQVPDRMTLQSIVDDQAVRLKVVSLKFVE
ncbi:hypothetical protein QLQ12_01240 [Actinoplanes sp. NEAU-A12]|uniref:Uncharacterized protein n=1 Tax=Actinoplanes sandaracinus TaxID=3045177 RepID=A0ABT6WBZ0_9ACTN|nr:hypothetical protein [Actinoplanes sandaracinus]MDI6097233.1 hypothetical protein [Actinoplanes sandaracinus]